jgi:hypothetical protein
VRGACETGVFKRLTHVLRTPIVVHHDVECRRVKKGEGESENVMEGV